MSEHQVITGPAAATIEELFSKPRRKLSFNVSVAGEDGEAITRTMTYQAISAKEYDKLMEGHPPTPKQREDQAVLNIDTFAPALIAAVSLDPKLTYEQAEQLYTDPAWSGGEVSSLYYNAQRVCNAGLDIPFNARG
jgi:hypothetical protein